MPDVLCPNCKVVNRDTARFCSECGTPLLAGVGSAPVEGESKDRTQSLDGLVQINGSNKLMNRYRLESELGRGGFGAVYKAWDENVSRPCAIKENLEVSAEAQRQFAREASVLANLSHPNLPRVTDHFTITGQGQYLVMDFVEGEDLATILDHQQTISVPTAMAWVLQVAEALDYLHDQTPPVLHRDIKPANIRITPRGKAMLVDFGLVKLFEASARTTMGARAVTPGYAPPEQYGRGQTDARSDIYALAATLFHMVTGVQPEESVQRISGTSQQSANQINPNVSPALAAVISKGMALDPSQRFQTAREFCQALQGVMQTAHEEPTAFGMRSPFAPNGVPSGPVAGGAASGYRPPSGQPAGGVSAGIGADSQPRPGSQSRVPSGPRPASRPRSQPVKRGWLVPMLIGGALFICILGGLGVSGLLGISLMPADTTATVAAQGTLGAQMKATTTSLSATVAAQRTRQAGGNPDAPAAAASPTPMLMAAPALAASPTAAAANLPAWPQVNTLNLNAKDSGWWTGIDTSGDFFKKAEVTASADRLSVNLEPRKADVFYLANNEKLMAGDRFIFSATLQQTAGAKENWQGLVFRRQDVGNFYLFGVSDVGMFGVWSYKNSTWVAVMDKKVSSAIKAGEPHHLLVYGQGMDFALFIDGQKVADVQIQDFDKGNVGLYFEVPGQENATFEATDVVFRAP
jgi:serine/threonine-protein kinase